MDQSPKTNGLSEVHKQMDKADDVHRGWLRFFGHFVIFAAIPNIVACVAQELGANHVYFHVGSLPMILGGVIFIYVYEFQDFVHQRNGKWKAYLDVASKSLGWTAGVLSWLAWWA